MRFRVPLASLAFLAALGAPRANAQDSSLDKQLKRALSQAGFTGTIEDSLAARLGPDGIDVPLAAAGRFLWFDRAIGLHDDASCASCHSPTNGWGDTQSIAIGVQSNGIVGPTRTGPRNLRRSPMTANAAFYPALMWDGRFSAPSGDPFDNSEGFEFPAPEGTTTFPPNDPFVTHLLAAQAFIPPTVLEEMAGFTGTAGTLGAEFDALDDGLAEPVPPPDGSGYRNDPIRQAVLERLNANIEYVRVFGRAFPEVADGSAAIDFTMVGRALAEFQFTQVAADAPIDQYARGDVAAMTTAEKRGALVFFGKGQCVSCHAVAGESNEMFSDFQNHVIAVPQVAPDFGPGLGNVAFDGPNKNEDYGFERTTHDSADRYMFRTAPLRNIARSPAFFHDGAFTDLEDAIRHHLDVVESATNYDPDQAGIAADLTYEPETGSPMLDQVDPLLRTPIALTAFEFANLVTFVRDGLLDPKSLPGKQCTFMPDHVPSGAALEDFPGCPVGHGHGP